MFLIPDLMVDIFLYHHCFNWFYFTSFNSILSSYTVCIISIFWPPVCRFYHLSSQTHLGSLTILISVCQFHHATIIFLLGPALFYPSFLVNSTAVDILNLYSPISMSIISFTTLLLAFLWTFPEVGLMIWDLLIKFLFYELLENGIVFDLSQGWMLQSVGKYF